MQSTDTTSCDPRTDSLPVNDDANRQLFYTRLQQVQGKEPKDIRNQVDQIFIHHFPSVKGDTNDRIVLLPDAAVKYPKLECRTSAKLQRLHINVCLGMSLAPLSLRGMFSSSSLAVVSQPRHGSTLISRPALPHRRWLVVVWLAVVSSADGLYAVALWQGCRCTCVSAWGPFWPPMPRPRLLLPRPPRQASARESAATQMQLREKYYNLYYTYTCTHSNTLTHTLPLVSLTLSLPPCPPLSRKFCCCCLLKNKREINKYRDKVI